MKKKAGIIYWFLTCTALSLFALGEPEDALLSQKRIATILIHPAHGGRDLGGISPNLREYGISVFPEKEVTLKIAILLEELLLDSFPETRIILTRRDDVSISLDERGNLMNSIVMGENEIGLYISIHTGSTINRATRGYRFMVDNFSDESFALTQNLHSRFANMFEDLPFLGIKFGYEYMNTQWPGVNVEVGYISNFEGAQLLSTDEGLKRIAMALFQGINDTIVEYY